MMLHHANVLSLLVDRYRFRELLDARAGREIWPSGVVTIMSFEFARQDDVQKSLAWTHWDLVVADEWHWIKGARAKALRQIGASADRVILASATPPNLDLSDAFPANDTTVVEWRSDQIVDHDGKPLNALPRPLLHEVAFNLSPAELSLRETVGSLCRIFEGGTPQQGWVAKSLYGSLQSSPAALEGALQRFVGRLPAPESMELFAETSEEDSIENLPGGLMDRAIAEKAAGIADHALQEIEAISSDSKLDALGGLLGHLTEAKTPPRQICVLTEYVGTLYYLVAEIEGHDTACQFLHGGMSVDDRRSSHAEFSRVGGILVSTRSIIAEGVNFVNVTDLVLYDVTASKSVLQEVLGRFNRFGRQTPLTVHVLAPSNAVKSLLSAPLETIRSIFGSPAVEVRPAMSSTPAFDRYIGIDYSGAQTPTSSLKGLRVYVADRVSPPVEVQPQPGARKYWTRRGIAEWLVQQLSEDRPTLVGIDHGFSCPLRYFEKYNLPHDWPSFLNDFQQHWPTDEEHIYVDFVREGARGSGADRAGNARWRRLTEERAPGAKSVFHFDVQGSVAKSTHAGLPWLRYLRQQLGGRVHFWPFDGWEIPSARSVVAEVYPRLWSGSFKREGRNPDQHDAYSVAAWMRAADLNGSLSGFFKPSLTPAELIVAQIEGWILGLK
jgi:hypothetical protein